MTRIPRGLRRRPSSQERVGYTQFTVLDDRGNDDRFPVPDHINKKLNEAKTPEQIMKIVRKHEKDLADFVDEKRGEPHHSDGYLGKDSGPDLIQDVLRAKGIAYEGVVGTIKGDTWQWVRINGRNYDPYGFAKPSYTGGEVVTRWDPVHGERSVS